MCAWSCARHFGAPRTPRPTAGALSCSFADGSMRSGRGWPCLQSIWTAGRSASAPGQALSVIGEAGSASWTVSIASTDPKSGRAWMTSVEVTDAGDADVMDIQTSCTDRPGVPLVVAPPSVLRLLVRNLDLDDGGVPIIGEARAVDDREQAQGFCEHVRSSTRTLPIIALASKPDSNYYGVDPAHLAEALSGLAHVACVGSPVLAEVAKLLDPGIAPVAGAAQIYEPPFNALTPKDRHSLVRQSRRAGTGSIDGGHLKRMLIQRACAMSAGASKGGLCAHEVKPNEGTSSRVGKRLELLGEVVRAAGPIAVLWDPLQPAAVAGSRGRREGARLDIAVAGNPRRPRRSMRPSQRRAMRAPARCWSSTARCSTARPIAWRRWQRRRSCPRCTACVSTSTPAG